MIEPLPGLLLAGLIGVLVYAFILIALPRLSALGGRLEAGAAAGELGSLHRTHVDVIVDRLERVESSLARLTAEAEPVAPSRAPVSSRAGRVDVEGAIGVPGLKAWGDDDVGEVLQRVSGRLVRLAELARANAETRSALRAGLGHLLILAAGAQEGVRRSDAELIWELERFGEQLGRLGADGSRAWSAVCSQVGELCQLVYDRDFEIYLPGEGEPVREEFHEVAGTGGHTVSRALRWGINDASTGRNVLRARVEVD